MAPENELKCPGCGSLVPPAADTCGVCGRSLTAVLGPTADADDALKPVKLRRPEQEVPKPTPDELPPRTRTLEIFLVLTILVLGVFLNLGLYRPKKEEIIIRWIDACIAALNGAEVPSYWTRVSDWPPGATVTVVSNVKPEDRFYDYVSLLIERSNVTLEDYVRLPAWRLDRDFQTLRLANPDTHWLRITGMNIPGLVSLEVSYWAPDLKGIPVFRFEKFKDPISLYWRPLTNLALVVFLAWLTRFLVVERYRKKRAHAYEAYQKRSTATKFEADRQLQEAKKLAESGQVAKALSKVNALLETMPSYAEAIAFKRSLIQAQQAGGADPSHVPGIPSYPSLPGTSPLLYLQILGTTLAYRVPPEAKSVIIGRQRRKPGDAPDVGSDVVLRVSGSQAKSLLISRRHLEIKRIGEEYFAIDLSKGKTKHNGRPFKPDEPVPLNSGDRLMIADVLILRVLIRLEISGSRTSRRLRIDPGTEGQSGLIIEATVGDMLTEVDDNA